MIRQRAPMRELNGRYLTNKSGCAKKSAYISNKDLLSRMKVGRTTCEHNEGETL